MKEGRGPRRSISVSGVVGSFPGLSRTTFKGTGEDYEEEEESSVEEQEPDCTEGVPSPVGASQGTEGPTLAQSNRPVSHKSEPSLLAIMQQMTQIMAMLQAASLSEASRPTAFKNSSMKVAEWFDGTQPFKFRIFFQFIYDTSFLIFRAEKWIEPYLSNLTNQDPSFLLNSWNLFEAQLFTFLRTQMKSEKLKQS
ncbi:hypothetical protein O181_091385 [Austropuccinia psidii MF-1]|uniref:Uncharacterized protein n=1 Tax=Austropuccinia psidii MF-1 TaxID=1389203 RepID=A0A9Q3IWQ0_9BASI|nr:hypothetical protein [Austropuccinia psidii MF-1]